MASYYSNRCKCISTAIMLILSIAIVTIGAMTYYMLYMPITQMKIDGSPYLPELQVSFDG